MCRKFFGLYISPKYFSIIYGIITIANKAYFALVTVFKSRIIHRETKMRIYKRSIRPILCYTTETWIITQRTIEHLEILKLKGSYGDGSWAPYVEMRNGR